MKEYTFIRTGGDKKHIEAMSLKKAIKKYDGKPNDQDSNALIVWTSKKGNISNQIIKLPYQFRKERKGRL
tara:strand:+ start:101 stop:310 length:210 start_codon:yes stop_codon:yes gene_type:complete